MISIELLLKKLRPSEHKFSSNERNKKANNPLLIHVNYSEELWEQFQTMILPEMTTKDVAIGQERRPSQPDFKLK